MRPSLKFVSDREGVLDYSGIDSLDTLSTFWAKSLELKNENKTCTLHLPATYSLRRMFSKEAIGKGPVLIGYKIIYPLTALSPRYLKKDSMGDNVIITIGTEKAYDIALWEGARYCEISLFNDGTLFIEVI